MQRHELFWSRSALNTYGFTKWCVCEQVVHRQSGFDIDIESVTLQCVRLLFIFVVACVRCDIYVCVYMFVLVFVVLDCINILHVACFFFICFFPFPFLELRFFCPSGLIVRMFREVLIYRFIREHALFPCTIL